MKIKIDTSKLNNQLDTFNGIQRKLSAISDKLDILSNKKDWDNIYDGIAESIKYDILSCSQNLQTCSDKSAVYCQFVQNAVNQYDTCERELNDKALGRGDTRHGAGYVYPEHDYIDETGALKGTRLISGFGEELTKGLIDEGVKQIVGKEIPVVALVEGAHTVNETFNQNRVEHESGDINEEFAEFMFGAVYNVAKIVAPIAIAAALIPAAAPVGVAILASAAIGITFAVVTDSVEYVIEDNLEDKETGERLSAQEHFENIGSGIVRTCKKIFAPLSTDIELAEPNFSPVYA